ncbi:MAG: tyrosine-type recombinase/integrase, partial [Cyanothece sp. SIO1E1]|nr:tyrosine-type recombinase/integrase [Cyanothece sp. SIO1E1]
SDLTGNRLRVRGKTGERSVVLSPDAAKFFAALAKGVNDLTRHLLVRADGTKWKDHDQWKPFIRAVAAAGLNPDTTLYAARHSYITRALSKGIPITAIAKQCGTSVKMIEETYSNFTAKELDAMFAFASRPD